MATIGDKIFINGEYGKVVDIVDGETLLVAFDGKKDFYSFDKAEYEEHAKMSSGEKILRELCGDELKDEDVDLVFKTIKDSYNLNLRSYANAKEEYVHAARNIGYSGITQREMEARKRVAEKDKEIFVPMLSAAKNMIKNRDRFVNESQEREWAIEILNQVLLIMDCKPNERAGEYEDFKKIAFAAKALKTLKSKGSEAATKEVNENEEAFYDPHYFLSEANIKFVKYGGEKAAEAVRHGEKYKDARAQGKDIIEHEMAPLLEINKKR